MLIKTEFGKVLNSLVKGTFGVIDAGWGATVRYMLVIALVGGLLLVGCWMLSGAPAVRAVETVGSQGDAP